MSEKTEPAWLSLTTFGAMFEEELDDNAPPGASEEVAFRHRRVVPAGQPPAEWKPGRAPD